jgi:hypothetical protein
VARAEQAMKIVYRGKYKHRKNLSAGFLLALDALAVEYRKLPLTLIIDSNGVTVCGLHTDKHKRWNTVTIDPYRSFNAQWDEPHLSTLGRQRTRLLRLTKVPTEYKHFVNLILDASHEVGHFKRHVTKNRRKDTIDHRRYSRDLEYRLKIEHEAEEEATRITKKYGFYQLINNLKYGDATA